MHPPRASSAGAMASATPNPFAWLRGHLGFDAAARTSRAPRDAGSRSRRRAFASLSIAGAAVAGDAALVAETPTWGGKPVTREELGRATWLFLHTSPRSTPRTPRVSRRATREISSRYDPGIPLRRVRRTLRRGGPSRAPGRLFRCGVSKVDVRSAQRSQPPAWEARVRLLASRGAVARVGVRRRRRRGNRVREETGSRARDRARRGWG